MFCDHRSGEQISWRNVGEMLEKCWSFQNFSNISPSMISGAPADFGPADLLDFGQEIIW